MVNFKVVHTQVVRGSFIANVNHIFRNISRWNFCSADCSMKRGYESSFLNGDTQFYWRSSVYSILHWLVFPQFHSKEDEFFKVPISENFLFSYLNLNITLRTSVKKFFDLHKTRIFYEFYKSLKSYFIAVHPPRWWECRQAHNRATWHGLWRTFRNSRVYALTWPSVKYIRGRKKIVRFTGRKEKLSSK